MEPKKIINCNRCVQRLSIILLIFVCSFQTLQAQRIWDVRKGCVRAQGNLAPGYFIAQKQVSAYFNGEMEMFFEDRFAYTGELSFSFPTLKKNQTGIYTNHAIFAGANYHFLKPHRVDPYVGLTPGAGFVRVAYKQGEGIAKTPFSILPLLSAQVGCNFYVCSFLHFFLKVQGVTGQVFSNLPKPARLDEIKMMGGMGWNFRIYKPKVKDVWL